MEELYQLIEEKIRNAGYNGAVDGEEIYSEICDEIEGKENGHYIFMVKKGDNVHFEYTLQVMDEQFNLSSINIVDNGVSTLVNFDE